jgi:hypothetical protein
LRGEEFFFYPLFRKSIEREEVAYRNPLSYERLLVAVSHYSERDKSAPLGHHGFDVALKITSENSGPEKANVIAKKSVKSTRAPVFFAIPFSSLFTLIRLTHLSRRELPRHP